MISTEQSKKASLKKRTKKFALGLFPAILITASSVFIHEFTNGFKILTSCHNYWSSFIEGVLITIAFLFVHKLANYIESK